MSDYSDISDLLSQSNSEVLSTLTSHGGSFPRTTIPEYVIHTHTVPLASTVDMHYLREGGKSLFHGYAAGNQSDCCPKRSCMYITATGNRTNEKVPENCPCLKIEGKNGDALKPRCFLTYVRSLGRRLASESDSQEYMDPSRIMFCQTHVGLFDNTYPGWMRDAIGVSGWEHIGLTQLLPVMNSLYWYRKYVKILKLDRIIGQACDKLGIRRARHGVTQAIHTINGVLLKKFMCFCPESNRYQDYAKQTAYLFRDLVSEYYKPIEFDSKGISEPQGLTYSELKEFLNTVKKTFHSESREVRASWMYFEFKSKSLRRAFSEIARLQRLVTSKTAEGFDYTESPAWIFRCTTLCQTRVLGYLPDCIAQVKRKQFRDTVSRPLEIPERKSILLITRAVRDELEHGRIPREFLLKGERNPEKQQKFAEAMTAIELPLKGAASTDHFVREGGKIEDARLLINKAIDNKWMIPIRDLHDNEVIDTFVVTHMDETDHMAYARPLFWLSYTIILNFFVSKGFYGEDMYYPLIDKGLHYRPDPMLASIVHISEPGKERNLTKSTGYLAWFLTPASKVTQDTLSALPEHDVGLRASNHEWRHQKRVSALSDESSFVYDIGSGKTHESIIHSFKDWTESTDFIGKMVGWAHLRAIFNYIGFPEAYMNLIAHAIMEPQPVRETVAYLNLDGDLVQTPIQWEGFINEGFMMGNPMTKTILHSIHISETGVNRRVLNRLKCTERPRGKYLGLGNVAMLQRDAVTSFERPQRMWT